MKTPPLLVTSSEDGASLRDFLAKRLKISKNKAKDLLNARTVFVNGRRVWMARHRLHRKDAVTLTATPAARRPAKRLTVLFEDDDCLIANKPSGILTNGPDSLEARLRNERSLPTLEAAHRLDKDTTGCLLFAKDAKALVPLQALFRAHKIKKTYHALVSGRITKAAQTVARPVKSRRAVTHLRVLDATEAASHLIVTLDTGRTHQIRRHLTAMGHPVLGDRRYGTRRPLPKRFQQIPRQMLHASGLVFRHPGTGQSISAKAPLPSDFRRCLRDLGLT